MTMKVSEFWKILGITAEQNDEFDSNIKSLSSNQLTILKKKIEDDIEKYGKQVAIIEDSRSIKRETRSFAKLHFDSIRRRIKTFQDLNAEFEEENKARQLASKEEARVRSEELIKFKVRGLELKEKVVCRFCQSAGSVYVGSVDEVIKTRINSIAARAVGLGTNTKKTWTRLVCTSCEMDWKVD